VIVCPLHWYFSPTHLAEAEAEMLRRGPPTLRGHLDAVTGAFLLCEGTHRIRAAHRLGIAPALVCVPWWRTSQALANARVAAERRGLAFERVTIDHARIYPWQTQPTPS
jgi:hypothetical protein